MEQRLRQHKLAAGDHGACRGGACPWWIFWVIWPVALGVKALAGLGAPLLALLSRPLVYEVTMLPILLIGAGLALLVVAAWHRDG